MIYPTHLFQVLGLLEWLGCQPAFKNYSIYYWLILRPVSNHTFRMMKHGEGLFDLGLLVYTNGNQIKETKV